MAELRACSRSASPSSSPPTARPGGSAGSRARCSRRCATGRRCSLDNVFSRDELAAWGARVERGVGDRAHFVCEPKIDGLAVSLTYQDGAFTRGATRGDGETGEDVTPNLRTIRSLPMRLGGASPSSLLEVRGEVYLPIEAFERINRGLTATGQRPFAQSAQRRRRQLAPGRIRRRDAGVAAAGVVLRRRAD